LLLLLCGNYSPLSGEILVGHPECGQPNRSGMDIIQSRKLIAA